MSMSKYASQADYWKDQAVKVVEKHRRHVELSPGVGAEVQSYALDVCDDILSDLRQLPQNGEAK